MSTVYAQAVRDIRLAAFAVVLDSATTPGKLRIYTGPRPGAGISITTEILLAEIIFEKPSVDSIVDNVLTFKEVEDVLAVGTGEPVWARFLNGDGVWVADADVSDDPGDFPGVLIDTLAVYAGGQVSVTLATLVE